MHEIRNAEVADVAQGTVARSAHVAKGGTKVFRPQSVGHSLSRDTLASRNYVLSQGR
jgi:hypothetical protein